MRKLLPFLCLPFCHVCIAQNTALNFNGTNSYVSTTANPVPVAGDFTVELWTYVASVGTGLREFVSQGSSTGGQNFYIGTDFSNGNIRCGDPWQITGIAMPVNQWVHVALVRSGTTAYLYLNGVLKGSQAGYTISTGGTNFKIGNQFGALSEYYNGKIDEVRVWNVARTAAQIIAGMDKPVSVSSTGLVAYYKLNEGSGTVAGNSTATTGLNGTLVNSPAWVSSPVQFSANALNFDGVDDQVVIPAASQYDISSGTVECWVNASSLGIINHEIVGARSTVGSRYSFHISSSAIGLWNGTLYVSVPYSAATGTWYHLAFVCNGTQTIVYVNGVSIGTIAQAFSSMTGLPVIIGISKNTDGSQSEAFNGSIDEVRIWNTQRTQAQIQANMNITLTGTEAGLVGLFSFDLGNAGGDNSNLVTAIDNTSNANHGVLTNFALTGSSSNFAVHSLALLPVILNSFTASREGSQAILQWQTAQEENSRSFAIERSADGLTYISIGNVDAAGNSSSPRSYSFTDAAPVNGKNYYRLKQVDLDGLFTYSETRALDFSLSNGLSWWLPGNRTVAIRLKQGNNEHFTITDTNGRNVQQGQLSGGMASVPLSMPGMYVVKVFTNAGELSSEIVVP
ncbi:MAG TPA: LamG-like jellyroll fold domain-containing protein [Chitinophagaceae bacterium]|jgi:hypothetical protein